MWSNYWYVSNYRIRTKTAADRAKRIADWIAGNGDLPEEPDERALFVALHTCAFRAKQSLVSEHADEGVYADWADRWERIREYIVEQNLGLVYSMMGKFNSSCIDEDDLLSDAMLGLTRAVDRFNPWKGYRLSTYACNVIARTLMRRGKRESCYRRLFPASYDAAFDQPDQMGDPATELYTERLRRALDRNLGCLTKLESGVLERRFFDDDGFRPTFREIGETIGLSKERIRQIQNAALVKLRIVLDDDPVLQDG